MLKKLSILLFTFILGLGLFSQTTLTVAENFHVKTIDGEPIWLFPLLDDENQIVVIDFFSTSCGPCQDYADDFQACYENFGLNAGNVYLMGINWGNDNAGVREFDSIFGLTYPSISGSQGGGNLVYQDYEILSYPTVIIITPDHNIVEQYVWPPDEETLTAAILAAGGIVGEHENFKELAEVSIFPNPVNSTTNVSVNLDRSANISMSIINNLGIEVYKSKSELMHKGNNTIQLDLSHYPKGNYFIRIVTDYQILVVDKLVIL